VALNKFLNELETFFNSHSDLVLATIEKESGIKWDVDLIEVCLFQGWQTSTSIPLLLNTYSENLHFCFFNLIHELIHNNILKVQIKDEEDNWDHLELEAIVNTILIRVLDTVFSKEQIKEFSSYAEFGGMYKYVWKRTRFIDSELNKINKDVAYWLEKNYNG
jgi:hypothetical protein